MIYYGFTFYDVKIFFSVDKSTIFSINPNKINYLLFALNSLYFYEKILSFNWVIGTSTSRIWYFTN